MGLEEHNFFHTQYSEFSDVCDGVGPPTKFWKTVPFLAPVGLGIKQKKKKNKENLFN